MKTKLVISLILFFSCSIIYGQVDLEFIADSILKEATKIYRLEKAAWVSTDDLLEKNRKKYFKNEIDGYLSYKSGDTIKCIYWGDTEDKLFIKKTYNFNNSDNLEEYSQLEKERTPTEKELKLIMVRNNLINDINNNNKIYYKPYGSEYNIIITEKEDGYRAYIIIGFKKKHIVPIGNDYCIEFDKNGEIVKRKRLHKSFIETPYKYFHGNKLESVLHTHLKDSQYITATDICNVMLYSEYIGWEKMEVITEYISTYNVKDKTLSIRIFKDK